MEEDKNAIEVIYELYSLIKSVDQKLDILSKNVNIVNDKINGKLLDSIGSIPKGVLPEELNAPSKSSVKDMPLPPNIKQEAEKNKKPAPQKPQKKVAAKQKMQQQSTRIYGKFIDSKDKPITGIEVTVNDANNNVVKQTKTNRAGEYNFFLPPGHYSVEFLKENMKPTFRVFQVIPGQKELHLV